MLLTYYVLHGQKNRYFYIHMEEAISGPDGGVSPKYSKEIRHNPNTTTGVSYDHNSTINTNDITNMNDITTACSNTTTTRATTTITDIITEDDTTIIEGAIVTLSEEYIIQLNEKMARFVTQ